MIIHISKYSRLGLLAILILQLKYHYGGQIQMNTLQELRLLSPFRGGQVCDCPYPQHQRQSAKSTLKCK